MSNLRLRSPAFSNTAPLPFYHLMRLDVQLILISQVGDLRLKEPRDSHSSLADLCGGLSRKKGYEWG